MLMKTRCLITNLGVSNGADHLSCFLVLVNIVSDKN